MFDSSISETSNRIIYYFTCCGNVRGPCVRRLSTIMQNHRHSQYDLITMHAYESSNCLPANPTSVQLLPFRKWLSATPGNEKRGLRRIEDRSSPPPLATRGLFSVESCTKVVGTSSKSKPFGRKGSESAPSSRLGNFIGAVFFLRLTTDRTHRAADSSGACVTSQLRYGSNKFL